jgi:hypothetical protein
MSRDSLSSLTQYLLPTLVYFIIYRRIMHCIHLSRCITNRIFFPRKMRNTISSILKLKVIFLCIDLYNEWQFLFRCSKKTSAEFKCHKKARMYDHSSVSLIWYYLRLFFFFVLQFRLHCLSKIISRSKQAELLY